MFHWTEASRLNANIRYLIKGAVLLQIRDTANLSGLLHGKLERLDPLLNFAQLLIADGKERPRFCQLTQQRILPVVRVAKKSTAFFKWCLKYDFSETKEMERRDSFLFLIQHTSDSSCSIFSTVWKTMSIPLLDSVTRFDDNLLDLRLQTSFVALGLLCQVVYQSLPTVNTRAFYLMFSFCKDSQLAHNCCRFGSAVTFWTCSSWARFLAAAASASSNVFSISAAWIITWQHIFFCIKNLKSYTCTYFSYREIQNCTHINVLLSRILLHTLTTHIYSLLQNVCFTL